MESQVSDKFKTGLEYKATSRVEESYVKSSEMLENRDNVKSSSDKRYHAVPPPYTRNYIPTKPDLIFIDEQVKSVYSTLKTKTIRKNSFSPPIIEDLNYDDESKVEFEPKVEVKTVRPCIETIKFVKTAREKVEKGMIVGIKRLLSAVEVTAAGYGFYCWSPSSIKGDHRFCVIDTLDTREERKAQKLQGFLVTPTLLLKKDQEKDKIGSKPDKKGSVATSGIEVMTRKTWAEMKVMMTEEFCPPEEIQRMESELWNLRVKKMDISSYTTRFNELAILCPGMVPTECKKVEAYIRGLSENIKGEVTSSEPATLCKAVRMAHTLMEQKVKAKAKREADNKKKKWENFQGGSSSGGGNNNSNRNNNNYNSNLHEDEYRFIFGFRNSPSWVRGQGHMGECRRGRGVILYGWGTGDRLGTTNE
nr:hypothetical protein [Tanacetum cinerariifolium]